MNNIPICIDIPNEIPQILLKPVCVDVLNNINLATDTYFPFADDGKTLVYPKITKYLHRIGFVYNQFNSTYYRLDPSTGLYYPVSDFDLSVEIYKFISHCNPSYSIKKSHIESIICSFNMTYHLNELYDRYIDFLSTEEGSFYEFDRFHKEHSLIQLNNGLFHPFLDYANDGYPFHLLPNCGVFFPHDGTRYDIDFYPIDESRIFLETPYDDFLTILGDHKTLEFFLWWAGAVLFSYPFRLPMFLLLYGPGGTGKTAIASSLISILGMAGGNADLSCLLDQKSKSCLIGKRLNLSSEMEGNYDKRLLSAIKEITGGSPIQVERKYKDAQTIYPPALIFTGNVFPEIDTSDTGIFRRACVIWCNTNLDHTGLDWPKIMSDNEHKNWLFNAAYYIWMKNSDKLPNDMKSESMLEIESRMIIYSPFTNWIENYCNTMDRETIRSLLSGRTLNELHMNYSSYVYDLMGKPLSRNKFSEKIQNDYEMVLTPIHNQRVFKYADKKKR